MSKSRCSIRSVSVSPYGAFRRCVCSLGAGGGQVLSFDADLVHTQTKLHLVHMQTKLHSDARRWLWLPVDHANKTTRRAGGCLTQQRQRILFHVEPRGCEQAQRIGVTFCARFQIKRVVDAHAKGSADIANTRHRAVCVNCLIVGRCQPVSQMISTERRWLFLCCSIGNPRDWNSTWFHHNFCGSTCDLVGPKYGDLSYQFQSRCL